MSSNRYNPSPRAQGRQVTETVDAPSTPERMAEKLEQARLMVGAENVQPEAPVATLQIAVLNGPDTLTAGLSPRKPAAVGKSAGYNLSTKVYIDASTPVLYVQVGGSILAATPKAFKAQPGAAFGSHGWYCGGKVFANGEECQLGANLIIVKSKEAATRPTGPVSVQVGINVTVIHSKLA